MRTFARITELRAALSRDRLERRPIGFVPTMGALHEGHLELIRRAGRENDRVVVSVFVNPLQFGAGEDYQNYPRDFEADRARAEEVLTDYLFAPETDEIYPEGDLSTRVEVGRIGEICEGEFRPGHFAGVATVCLKLFNIVAPDRAYFGEKDAQQLAVVRRVVADLDLNLEVVGCPTVRESDGLAISSRNAYLDEKSRRAARVLPRALFEALEMARAGERSADKLERMVADRVAAEPAVTLQYVRVVDPDTFESLEEVGDEAILALAALVGGVRLIDNLRVGGTRGRPEPPDLKGLKRDRANTGFHRTIQ